MTALTNFIFPADDGTALGVRSLTIDGEPWFVAADVCRALGLGNTAMALERLDDDEKGVSSIDTPSKNQHGDYGTVQQEMTIVNESGLYSLVLGSRKPEAKRFKKWLTSEVLPTIRKTGAYIGPDAQLAGARLQPMMFASHAADIMVAADRTFRSAIRAGRSAGMGTAAAIRRANTIALQRTGLNLLDELQAHEHVAAMDVQTNAPSQDADPGRLSEFWAEYEAGTLAGGACLPLLSSQAHALYCHWCLRTGVEPVTLPRMVHGLRVQGLVRSVRKRHSDSFGGLHGPAGFLLPAGPLEMPFDQSETRYLGQCVEQIEQAMTATNV